MDDRTIIREIGRVKCAELTLIAHIPGEDLYTVQYSPKQDVFHIELLRTTFEFNQMIMLRSFTGIEGSDFILIALAKDHDSAVKIVEEAKNMRKKLRESAANN